MVADTLVVDIDRSHTDGPVGNLVGMPKTLDSDCKPGVPQMVVDSNLGLTSKALLEVKFIFLAPTVSRTR